MKEQQKSRHLIGEQALIFKYELDEIRTNHKRHFVITLVSCGLWTVVWMCVIQINFIIKNDIRRFHLQTDDPKNPIFILLMVGIFYAGYLVTLFDLIKLYLMPMFQV